MKNGIYFNILIQIVGLITINCELEDPCNNFSILTNGWRHVDNGGGQHCDDNLQEGWYKVEYLGQPATIPTRCIRNNECGFETPLTIQLPSNQSLPSYNQTIDADVCGSRVVSGRWRCCAVRQPTKIHNCGDFLVYRLTPTTYICSAGYCIQGHGETIGLLAIKTGEVAIGQNNDQQMNTERILVARESPDPTSIATNESLESVVVQNYPTITTPLPTTRTYTFRLKRRTRTTQVPTTRLETPTAPHTQTTRLETDSTELRLITAPTNASSMLYSSDTHSLVNPTTVGSNTQRVENYATSVGTEAETKVSEQSFVNVEATRISNLSNLPASYPTISEQYMETSDEISSLSTHAATSALVNESHDTTISYYSSITTQQPSLETNDMDITAKNVVSPTQVFSTGRSNYSEKLANSSSITPLDSSESIKETTADYLSTLFQEETHTSIPEQRRPSEENSSTFMIQASTLANKNITTQIYEHISNQSLSVLRHISSSIQPTLINELFESSPTEAPPTQSSAASTDQLSLQASSSTQGTFPQTNTFLPVEQKPINTEFPLSEEHSSSTFQTTSEYPTAMYVSPINTESSNAPVDSDEREPLPPYTIITNNRTVIAGHDKSTATVFVRHIGLFLAIIVISTVVTIMLVLVLAYLRTRGRTGYWKCPSGANYAKQFEKNLIDRKTPKKILEISSPIPDMEILQDEENMREITPKYAETSLTITSEEHDKATSVSLPRSDGSSEDTTSEKGWMEPLSELEKAISSHSCSPQYENTKL